MDKRFPKEIPINAYRLQMGTSMTFKDVITHLPYLKDLGIDTIYTSPYFECVPGKGNPYAITSCIRLNPEVGTVDDFWAFSEALEKGGFKHIIDFVPNHMAADEHHPWFRDLLRNGESSKYASYFDVFWDNHLKGLKGKILLPILSGQEVKVLGHDLLVGDRKIPLCHESDKVEDQHYQLCEWQDSCHRTNYRRFFDIHDLIGMNVENPEVFEAMHALVFEMAASGAITGIRIDHPDGLYDPAGYFHDVRLRTNGIYLIAEKILQEGEHLDPRWEVDGTVGYSYLNQLTRLYVDEKSERAFDSLYWKFLGEEWDIEERLYLAKKEIVTKYISGEVSILAHHLHQIVSLLVTHYKGDYQSLKDVLIEFLSHMVVYRTYVTSDATSFSIQDQAAIAHAFDEMERYSPKLCGESFALLKTVFSIEYPSPFRRVYSKLQQIMPCVFAKAFEDTFLYNYNRLLALNEVGGDPSYFGMSPDHFHLENRMRLERYPYSMITTTTHDTKRSHDVRMRLAVLSEMPEEWAGYIQTFRQIANPQIDANTEYFIYQTFIALWPLDREGVRKRLLGYMVKALRESKQRTNWVEVDEKYEAMVCSFCERLMDNALFVETLDPFARRVAACGELNSFSSLAVTLCSPGVFDLYQGSEVYNDSLVDPDNRRETDFSKMGGEKREFLKKGLNLRLKEAELFLHGSYEQLPTNSRHLVAFRRVLGEKEVICLAGRFFSQLQGDIKTSLELEGDWVDLMSGKRVKTLPEINRERPFAILCHV